MKKLLVLIILMTVKAHAVVWDARNQWSDEWERAYSNWVEQDFITSYFVSGPYGQIVTDCADAVYAARAIFAYENSLPFIVHQAGSEEFITNRNSSFDNVTTENHERFKRFLTLLFDSTSTESLSRDTYPVAINRETIRPGVVWLRPSRNAEAIFFGLFGHRQQDVGHAEIVKGVSATGVITLMSSTVPASARELKEVTDFYFVPDRRAGTGLRVWKQPEQIRIENSAIPAYSEDQYHMSYNGSPARGLGDWSRAIQARLALAPESSQDYLTRIARNFCVVAHERISIVQEGEALRNTLGGACMNAAQYEDYSTPSRDRNIERSLQQLYREATNLRMTSGNGARQEKLRPFLETCGTLDYRDGVSIDYVELARRVFEHKISSDPNQPIEARWGETAPLRLNCPH